MQLLHQFYAVLLISLICIACAKQLLGTLTGIDTAGINEACFRTMKTNQRHALHLWVTEQLVSWIVREWFLK